VAVSSLRRGLVLLAVVGALVAAAGLLVPAAVTSAGSPSAVTSPLLPGARICVATQKCAPGHTPGVPAPGPTLIAIGAILATGVALGATRRPHNGARADHTPVGFPVLPFRPPITV
jgi:hypothetical protein